MRRSAHIVALNAQMIPEKKRFRDRNATEDAKSPTVVRAEV